eukprot:TRINITY_DN1882_c1_g1_i1.p1 TRINITY_DN1882_c1_g1~~TRINITY_DN1882_c1_g1_i1.p1  ORF type:complete len:219 (-),score=50.80 TRINITY_DN1882_c1_g1_i1:175-792(-)
MCPSLRPSLLGGELTTIKGEKQNTGDTCLQTKDNNRPSHPSSSFQEQPTSPRLSPSLFIHSTSSDNVFPTHVPSKRIPLTRRRFYTRGSWIDEDEEIQEMEREGEVSLTICNNYPLRVACEQGYTEVVKWLLSFPQVDPTQDDNLPLKMAIANGHKEIVLLLTEDSRIKKKSREEKIEIPIIICDEAERSHKKRRDKKRKSSPSF